MTYTINLEGQITDLQKLLVDFENNMRTSDVNSVRLSKDKTIGDVLEDINVTGYYIGIDFEPGVAKTSTNTDNTGEQNE